MQTVLGYFNPIFSSNWYKVCFSSGCRVGDERILRAGRQREAGAEAHALCEWIALLLCFLQYSFHLFALSASMTLNLIYISSFQPKHAHFLETQELFFSQWEKSVWSAWPLHCLHAALHSFICSLTECWHASLFYSYFGKNCSKSPFLRKNFQKYFHFCYQRIAFYVMGKFQSRIWAAVSWKEKKRRNPPASTCN